MLGPGTLGQLQLAENDRAGRIELAHHGGILGGTEVPVDRHAGRRRHALCPAQVLHRDRHAMQWPADLAAHDLGLGGTGLHQRCLGHHVCVALELAVQLLDARKLGLWSPPPARSRVRGYGEPVR